MLCKIKDLEGKKYFTSVARNDSGEWIIASNAPKTLNNIQNKIKGGGEVLYSTLPELPIIAKSELSAKALNSEVGKAETTKPALKSQVIPHNKAFGTNFEEFYHDPKGAIAKLLESKEGQVAGAFYREDLGDIDLVWGEIRDQKGNLQGYGLSKIVEKHLDDFKGFEGNSAYEKLSNGLEEIVRNGKLVSENGINTLWLKEKGEYYLAGLSKG
ncbi:hypothetical protein [Helicobacter suis]|uniref:putative barnase/colicin E5 family endoribonuclease n=1 Tax=Helicobacter suis TaxID=104628 RepID=UPI0013D26C88|nr:hypothetical protein [Helicobacter suis]